MTTSVDVVDRALNRIVRLPMSLATDLDTRQRLCDLLQGAGIFGGLTWPDARMVADAISADAGRVDGVAAMRDRASRVTIGRETWDDRTAVVWALTVAADVLDALGPTTRFDEPVGETR